LTGNRKSVRLWCLRAEELRDLGRPTRETSLGQPSFSVGKQSSETYVPAQQSPQEEEARLPTPDAYPPGSRHHQSATQKRAQAPFSLSDARPATPSARRGIPASAGAATAARGLSELLP